MLSEDTVMEEEENEKRDVLVYSHSNISNMDEYSIDLLDPRPGN